MGARAQAVDATRRRIMDALIALAGERPFAEVTLDTIAERAGVSVQTVLRQFGSRDGLFAEAMDAAMVDAEDERRTPPGDVARSSWMLTFCGSSGRLATRSRSSRNGSAVTEMRVGMTSRRVSPVSTSRSASQSPRPLRSSSDITTSMFVLNWTSRSRGDFTGPWRMPSKATP